MRGRLRDLGIGIAVALAFALGAETLVRLSWTPPFDWPLVGGAAPQPNLHIHPLLGARPRPGWSGLWSQRALSAVFPVQIDVRGFRSTDNGPVASGSLRVAALGDSCTFGWGMVSRETYLSRTEAALREGGTPVEMLNAAMPGDTAVAGKFVLEQSVLPYEPDAVILAFSAHNAFRLATESDIERFKHFGLRRLALRSSLIQLILRSFAKNAAPRVSPRSAEARDGARPTDLRRIASVGEFEAALRSMVGTIRSRGALPLLLILPRASEVSSRFRFEDAAVAVKWRANSVDGRAAPQHLLAQSCLDRPTEESLASIRDRAYEWQPVYPSSPPLLSLLEAGAREYVRGDFEAATRMFVRARTMRPNSPLANYDLGVSLLAQGVKARGLELLAEADALACNVYLQYQTATWRVATELDVPAIDIVLHFQSKGADAGELFIDPAHPTSAGHEIIANALAPALKSVISWR